MMTEPNLTIGPALGDRMSDYCVVNAAGQVVARGRVPTDRAAMTQWLRAHQGARVVLEVGTHSPW